MKNFGNFDIKRHSSESASAEEEPRQKPLKERLSELLGSVREFLGIEEEAVEDIDDAEYIEKEIGQLTSALEKREGTKPTLLEKLRRLPKAVKGGIGTLLLATEISAAEAAFRKPEQAEPTKKEYKVVQQLEKAPAPPISIRFEGDHAIVEGDDLGFFVKHNFKFPESVADVGKMFLEPLSFGVKFKLGEKGALAAKIITGAEGQPFVFEAEVPYEYARDFKKASPVDRKKMEEDMEHKAKELIDNILPTVVGLSFYKKDVREIGRQGSVEINEVTIDGFASPESDRGIDTSDPRNKVLSEMRAENAANVLQRLFQKKGIDVGEIKYRGVGEAHLLPEEHDKLLEDAYEINLGVDGLEDEVMLELVKKYNRGEIASSEVKENLDRIIGDKRKVAISVETNERSYVLILPLPIFLIAGMSLLKKLSSRREYHGRPRVYAEFVPGPHSGDYDITEATRKHARKVGKDIRPLSYPRVRPRKDVIKGYAGKTRSQEQYAQEVVEGAKHKAKRRTHKKVLLDLDPRMPLPDRVRALAFVVDRYLRMAPTLLKERNIFGKLRDKYFDLVNVYQDREALGELLGTIIQRDATAHRAAGTHFREKLPGNGRVTFEFLPLAYSRGPERGGVKARRASVFLANVSVGGIGRYEIDRSKLHALADEYISRHKIKGKP